MGRWVGVDIVGVKEGGSFVVAVNVVAGVIEEDIPIVSWHYSPTPPPNSQPLSTIIDSSP